MSSTASLPTPPLSKALVARIHKESKQLIQHPPPGIAFWNATEDESSLTRWSASIVGPVDSPYTQGTFTLDITLPDRYPFIPPIVRFTTPIYHPNIDESGRICLDLLNMPPKGSWNPSINLLGIFTSLQALLQQPNPNDPLLQHIAQQYKTNQQAFVQQARAWTEKHAMQGSKMRSDAQPTTSEQTAAAATSKPSGNVESPVTSIASSVAKVVDSDENTPEYPSATPNTQAPVLQPLTATAKRKRVEADPLGSDTVKR